MKRKWLFSILAVSALLIAAYRPASDDRYFDIVRNLDIFATLFKEVNAYYVDEVNPSKLMNTGIAAMLNSLDPYTDYIPEDAIEDYRTMTTGEYGGIGALVDQKKGVSTVRMVYKGYAADRAGLKAGDQILKINGIDLKSKTSEEISQLLKGQSNSDIVLTIQRPLREGTLEVPVGREKITIRNVPYHGMVTENIGLIKLTEFTSEAGASVRSALLELKADGATSIILDLRDNPGGLLEEAINVSNVFIPKGKEVVTTRGKLSNWTKTYNTLNEPADLDIPLVVLISNGSASASEIVSGVVQDYDRGVLIGQQSFGKGLVQQTRPLAYNSQLKVTTAKYYIPSGRCIQAIDYSHRNPDGSVGKIPDSLRSEFKTASGRLVYDGGGVSPDLPVEAAEFSPITYTLLYKDLIFDYATEYYYAHPQIAPAKDFKLTDSEYQEFVSWLKGKDYDYTTKVEKDIERLIASAKDEKYYDDISDFIGKLKSATLHNKEQDLVNFKSEIKRALEAEIVSRYYYQEGAIEVTFDDDADVTAAIEVLNSPERYSQILKK